MGNPHETYDGMGIFLSGGTDHSIVKNCVVVNVGGEGLSLRGSYNNFEYNAVYADDNSTGTHSAMDYYFVLKDSYYNIISNNYIERVGNLKHVGHGFTVKEDNQHNLFEYNVAVNMNGGGFVARHQGSKFNSFVNNTVIGGYGIAAREGASENLFENIEIRDSRYGIFFLPSLEDQTNTQLFGSLNNTFKNITMENISDSAIFLVGYNHPEGRSENNVFDGIHIDGAKRLIKGDHRTSNNTFRNSTIVNVGSFAAAAPPRDTSEIDFQFTNVTVSDGAFSLP